MNLDIEELLEAPYKKEEKKAPLKRRPSKSPDSKRSQSREIRRDSYRDSKDYRRRDDRDYDRRSEDRDYRRVDRNPSRDPEMMEHRLVRVSKPSDPPPRRTSRDVPDHETRMVRVGSPDSFDGSPDSSITEIERNARTVFVTQLAARLTTKEFADFFSNAGRVRDVRIVIDKITGRSKGVGYVEFCDPSSIQAAVALTGQKLLGVPVQVQASGAEKNYTGELAIVATAAHAAVVPFSLLASEDTSQRLYIGSLHHSFTEEDIHRIFELLGEIEYVNLQKTLSGESKGYCYIQYQSSHDAKAALDRMNGYELGGRQLKVELVKDDSGHVYTEGRPSIRTSCDRLPTCFVLMKNVFDLAEESEEEWDKDLELALRAKLAKYEAESIVIDKQSNSGDVYIRFEKIDCARSAQKSFDGRYFAARQIACFFLTRNAFMEKFPAASSGVKE